MQVKNSLDWDALSIYLRNELHSVDFNPDLMKVYKNVGKMIAELSRAEVESRRLHNKTAELMLDKVNKSIVHLEQLILIAKLMK